MLAFGLWWLGRAEASARRSGEAYGGRAEPATRDVADDQFIRERATSSHEFDVAEILHGKQTDRIPSIGTAIIPLLVVVGVNLLMSLFILPRLDFSFLAEEHWGRRSLASVAGVWSVAVALAFATATLVVLNKRRLPDLRASMDAGANASVLPIFSVASLVGFGAVVAALPAFAVVRDCVLSISGGPLVSLAIATNVLAALTGSASGGLTIALDALGDIYLQIAHASGIEPALMHRIAVIGSGTLDSLPHNGAVVTLLAVCNSTHRKSYVDMVMANIVGPIIALVVVIFLGSMFGSF
jgi:H+/gluconate symporter-like permease